LNKHQRYNIKGHDAHNAKPAVLSHRHITDIDFKYLNLAHLKLQVSNVENCLFQGVDLSCTKITSTFFKNCRFISTTFSKAQLTNSSFVNCRFDRVAFNGADLAETSFSSCQTADGVYVNHAQVAFGSHGQQGRRLTAMQFGKVVTYDCGCFKGTEKELKRYIKDNSPAWKESRLAALLAVNTLLKIKYVR
jgi:uncharacterized protein YjbI with pentapeptide repeats